MEPWREGWGAQRLLAGCSGLFEIGSKDVELVGKVASASSSYLRRRDRFLAGRGSVIDTAGVIVTFH